MEDRVLATFPLCIRLRNDVDQRTGNRHLHMTNRITADATPAEEAVAGRITAARLLTKPHESEATTSTSDEEAPADDEPGGDS